MVAILKEQYQDALEYVKTIEQYGGDQKMAEFQARYYEEYTNKSIKSAIADLHLERFATKEDMNNVKTELKADIENLRHETKLEIQAVRFDMKAMENRLLLWQFGIGITIMGANFAMLKFFLGH
jgi:hypothetical protein